MKQYAALSAEHRRLKKLKSVCEVPEGLVGARRLKVGDLVERINGKKTDPADMDASPITGVSWNLWDDNTPMFRVLLSGLTPDLAGKILKNKVAMSEIPRRQNSTKNAPAGRAAIGDGEKGGGTGEDYMADEYEDFDVTEWAWLLKHGKIKKETKFDDIAIWLGLGALAIGMMFVVAHTKSVSKR